MTRCWFCGTEMIWGSDYDFKDFGLEDDGIVAVLHCPCCNTLAEFYYTEGDYE